jgi:nucleoid DNA-binding protein
LILIFLAQIFFVAADAVFHWRTVGDQLTLPGIGKLALVDRKARIGRNPVSQPIT